MSNMPYSLEAEQALLGAILINNESMHKAAEILSEYDFYVEAHQKIFAGMSLIYDRGEPIDIITLSNEITKTNDLGNVGGTEYIGSLALEVPTSANFEYYINIISEKSLLRKLIKVGEVIIKDCSEENDSAEILVEKVEQEIFKLTQNKGRKSYYHIREVLYKNFDAIEKIYAGGDKISGVPSGILDLDHRLGGFQNSDLLIVAARPAMGKTSFALNIAENVAIKSRVPVIIFTLEMSKEQLVNRILWSQAMVESEKIKTGALNERDFESIGTVIGPISDAPIYIDDTPSITMTEIKSKCRQLKLQKNLGLVIIDYLQLIQGNRRIENRQQEISEISRGLKMLAKEIDVPVIALSQLSRAVEARTSNHRPKLSDLRESGSIEQDADIVMFLYRDAVYNPETENPNIAECIIEKNRNGSTGTVEMLWMGQYTKFDNLEKRYTDAAY